MAAEGGRAGTSSVCTGQQCVSTYRGGWAEGGMLPISLSSVPSAPKGVNQKATGLDGDPCVSSEGKRKAVGCWEGRDMAGAQGCLGLSLSCKQASSQQTEPVKRLQSEGQARAAQVVVWSAMAAQRKKGLDCGFFESSLHNLKLGGTQKSHIVSPCLCQLESWLRVSRDNNHTKG